MIFTFTKPGDLLSLYQKNLIQYSPLHCCSSLKLFRVQVRRTDKLAGDSVFHPIEECMQYVEEWYKQQQVQGVNVTQKRVYLATEEPTLLEEVTAKYAV